MAIDEGDPEVCVTGTGELTLRELEKFSCVASAFRQSAENRSAHGDGVAAERRAQN